MLVLSRKRHERIWIYLPDGRRIMIECCAIRDAAVRIGIDAPLDIHILRQEVAAEEGYPIAGVEDAA